MSYYLSNGTTVYSDAIPGAKQVEDIYSYKSYLNPNSDRGVNSYYLPALYVKDGSVPWFDPSWNYQITSFSAQHICLGRMTISSISGKYNLPNLTHYTIPGDISPELYKLDLYKVENGKYVNKFNSVDLTKGGKVSWRTSTNNIKNFNYYDYNNFGNLSDGKNVFHNLKRNECFINDRTWIFYGSTDETKVYYIGRMPMKGGRTYTHFYNGPTERYISSWVSNENQATLFNTLEQARAICPGMDGQYIYDVLDKTISNTFSPSIGHFLKDTPNVYPGAFDIKLSPTANLDKRFIARSSRTGNDRQFYKGNTAAYTDSWSTEESEATIFETFTQTKAIYDEIPASTEWYSYINCADVAPLHFTLDKTKISSDYSKLRLTMDSIFMYGNNGFGQVYVPQASTDTNVINNYASFSSNNGLPGTNPFAIALFYATNNDTVWSVPYNTFDSDHPYINNGEIFSNLQTNGVNKPIVKDTKHYKIKYIKFNNAEIPEVQKLTNTNVWNHAHFITIPTGLNLLYTSATEETATCPNIHGSTHYQDCPYCRVETFRGNAGDGSIACAPQPLRNIFPEVSPNIFLPYYSDSTCTTQVGTSSLTYWSAGFNCCNEKGYVQKYYVKNGRLYSATQTATCPVCQGKGYNWCKCVDTHYKDTFVTAGVDDFGNTHTDYKLQFNTPVSGRVHCTECWESNNNKVKPYKNNTVLYRFKFYGKNIEGTKTFEGYVKNSTLSGITGSLYYKQIPWDEEKMTDEKGQTILNNEPSHTQGGTTYEYYGVYQFTETKPSDFVDYSLVGTANFLSAYNTPHSASWLVYVEDYYRTNENDYYWRNDYIRTPGIWGINAFERFNPIWDNKTSSTNTTVEDKFGNPVTIYKWNETGNSPGSSTNFTLANLKLTYDVDLSECTGQYIHVAYPYTTFLLNSNLPNYNAALLSQASITYEAIK